MSYFRYISGMSHFLNLCIFFGCSRKKNMFTEINRVGNKPRLIWNITERKKISFEKECFTAYIIKLSKTFSHKR